MSHMVAQTPEKIARKISICPTWCDHLENGLQRCSFSSNFKIHNNLQIAVIFS